MDINQLIGKRLAALKLGREERRRFVEAMGWDEQTYYQARIGRRTFRVVELVAMARAAGVPAWTFLDASGISRTVSLNDEAGISSAALCDLFQAPIGTNATRHSLTRAKQLIQTAIDNLVGPNKPAEGGMAHQLSVAVRLINLNITKGGSK